MRRRPRRRHDGDKPLKGLARGFLVIALLGGVAAVALRSYNGVPLRDYTTMYVTAPAAGNLRAHDQVRLAGTRVGQVSGLSVAPDGRARIELQLEPDAPSLPSDTKVAVRAAGLLGARYVEIIPGRSDRMLTAGSTIRAGDDTLTFGMPEMLDTFDGETRAAFGSMLGELGTGLLGRGSHLNDAIRDGAGGQRPLQDLAESVLARPGAAQRFFPAFDRMATALAASRNDFARMFSPMAEALSPFVDERHATQAALDEAPSALSAASDGLTRGRRLLSATSALATAANVTLPGAPRGLRAVTAMLRTSHTPLRRIASLLRATTPSIPAMLRITAAASPVLHPMRRGFDDLVPMVAYVGRYGCDIRHLGAVFRSMTGIGSTPGTEVGAIGQFRFQIIPSPAENVGSAKPDTARTRHRYPPPCKYLRYTEADNVGGRP